MPSPGNPSDQFCLGWVWAAIEDLLDLLHILRIRCKGPKSTGVDAPAPEAAGAIREWAWRVGFMFIFRIGSSAPGSVAKGLPTASAVLEVRPATSPSHTFQPRRTSSAGNLLSALQLPVAMPMGMSGDLMMLPRSNPSMTARRQLRQVVETPEPCSNNAGLRCSARPPQRRAHPRRVGAPTEKTVLPAFTSSSSASRTSAAFSAGNGPLELVQIDLVCLQAAQAVFALART